jgi:hypothetical protein
MKLTSEITIANVRLGLKVEIGGFTMYLVVVKYSRNNEVFHYESLEEAKNKYNKVVESGRIAYLTNVIEVNI